MNNNYSFTVIGGDTRQLYLANMLSAEGYDVSICGFDHIPISVTNLKIEPIVSQATAKSDAIILPMPVMKDTVSINTPLSNSTIQLSEISESLTPQKVVFGGQIPADFVSHCGASGIKIFDYLQREELAVLNAIPTAEGALQIAMKESDFTIFGSKCLVCGYGRIGKILALMLKNLGADVTVSARKYSDFAWIKAGGFRSVHSDNIKEIIRDFDIVFNTIPHLILNSGVLEAAHKEIILIDLASKPGGIDFDRANELQLKYRWALSLPGKVAPKTAAEIIKDTIKNIIEEEKL